ncbi:hypothetical protein ACJMK2_010293 [Sinanodonta woodiana]|uniref:TIR domain-containing protein n=1 Tax=Sinanodonta woodiana TaxID=1069815 RepID=A0ABD3VHW0_SINWO
MQKCNVYKQSETINVLTLNRNYILRDRDQIKMATKGFRTHVLPLILAFTIVNTQDIYDPLPKGWDKFCTIDGTRIYRSEFTPNLNMTLIKCNMMSEHSGIWRLDTLRETMKNATDKYAIDLHCTGNANVSLPWPIKILRVHELNVYGCILTDYLEEHDSDVINIIPDSLHVLRLVDTEISVRVKTFIKTMQNVKNISKEFDCGHEDTIEKLTRSNISYSFIEDMETVIVSLSELGAQFMQDSKEVKHKCVFSRLTELQEVHESSQSKYHLKLLVDNSILRELRMYNLSHNYISDLDGYILEWSTNFPKLEMLDLSHNAISQLYKFKIPLTSHATTINLQYNNISMITVEDLKHLKKMSNVTIDLQNNPLICGCDHRVKDLISFVNNEEDLDTPEFNNYQYIRNMACSSPNTLKGTKLYKLRISDLECGSIQEKEYFMIPIICLTVSAVVCLSVIVILVKYRKEVRIIMFTRFHIILPCQSESVLEKKLYDAFVSYSSVDEKWVDIIFKRIEQSADEEEDTDKSQSRKFKFCLHHRDFIPGRTIFDNVIKCVESSRHTIVLLSRNFIRSEYCLYEFQEAFQQSILEQKRHLIIVMIEEVPTDELPKELQRCLKTFTYIKKDDFLFLDRLIYALKMQGVEKKSYSKSNGQLKNPSMETDTNPSNETKKKDSSCMSKGFLKSTTQINKSKKPSKLNISTEEHSNTTSSAYDRSVSIWSTDTGYDSEKSPTINQLSMEILSSDSSVIDLDMIATPGRIGTSTTDCVHQCEERIE